MPAEPADAATRRWILSGSPRSFLAPLLLGGLVVSSPLLAAPKPNQVTLEDGPAQPESSEPTITFAFKEATFEQVVDFFGRAAGLPVVWEAAPPAGTLRYQSDRTYGID